MLSDEGGTYPDAPEGLCRQLVQECLRRRYAGVVLDAMPPEGFCRTLDELLARQERQLYLPEAAAGYAPHGTGAPLHRPCLRAPGGSAGRSRRKMWAGAPGPGSAADDA